MRNISSIYLSNIIFKILWSLVYVSLHRMFFLCMLYLIQLLLCAGLESSYQFLSDLWHKLLCHSIIERIRKVILHPQWNSCHSRFLLSCQSPSSLQILEQWMSRCFRLQLASYKRFTQWQLNLWDRILSMRMFLTMPPNRPGGRHSWESLWHHAA
jgi:hypothetical protein